MRRVSKAARLADQILRAMEDGSRRRLKQRLENAAALSTRIDDLPSYDAEQAEVLSAIAGQFRNTGTVSAPQVRILQHFAATVRVSLC